MKKAEKKGTRKGNKILLTATAMITTIMIILLLSRTANAEPCLIQGYVFNIGQTAAANATPVTIYNLGPPEKPPAGHVKTGENYPPIPVYYNQYKYVIDCIPGTDLIEVVAENSTYYGKEDATGQYLTEINITMDQVKKLVDIRVDPRAGFARPEEYTNFSVNVTNHQLVADSFTLSLSNTTDIAYLNQTSVTIAAGGSALVTLTARDDTPGDYQINITATSTTTPSVTDTYELTYVTDHKPIASDTRIEEWNTTNYSSNASLVPFDHYINITITGKDLDGERDTSQIVACSNDIWPVNGSCAPGAKLCDIMDAPVKASTTGQELSCIHATNKSLVASYVYVCDSLNECAKPEVGYWCEDECNLTINITMSNKTFDNSPSFKAETKLQGTVSVPTYCYYKTDYNPTNYTQLNTEAESEINYTMPEQNWSYIPTNLGRYPFIQHYNYYNGWHNLTIKCNATGLIGENSTRFKIEYTQRDKVYYQDGDQIKLYLRLEKSGLNVTANFSQLDSGFTGTNYVVNNTGLDYNITYNISLTNTRPDGQYNVTIHAFEPNGTETMNGSIFVHLHNNWTKEDISNAFDCWSFKQGYYFDEVACDWESDLNHVADLVDVFRVEISCFDNIDNDLDGKTDINDTDCAGQYYSIRREVGIDSAFLGDPCFDNVCRACVGGVDNNNDGVCDQSTGDGVNVRYLNYVRPGQEFRIKFLKNSGVNGKSIRLSVNYFNETFNITENKSSIVQLPKMELGGCDGGERCKSVTATTYNPPNPDTFTGTQLAEKITTRISENTQEANYSNIAAGKSIDGLSAFQNLVFFQVNASAIINESDNASYCFDTEDNDLNDYADCQDKSCDQISDPATNNTCEYGTELTCDDGFDNDGDGYTDCQDNDCFQKNGTTGPCYAVEDHNSTSCANGINDDFDWGRFGNASISRSYEDKTGSDIQLTDCLDIDCDRDLGSVPLNAKCEYAKEDTCNDGFDNDADGRYDCTGNAYKTSYERDCTRWNNPLGSGPLYPCPRFETICDDQIDNDLDSDYPNGAIDPYLHINTSYGGWDCQDIDCNGKKGDPFSNAICEFRNETSCDDGFDNDADGLTDCYDPVSCTNTSGSRWNLTGLCRPCPKWENITIDSCRDGKDTDYNGLIDCEDPDCYGMPGPGRSYCGYVENCTDGTDNDYDGLIDQADPDCQKKIISADETGPGMCTDGIDNDEDGNTDCADSDCATNMRCILGSYNNPCADIGYVGAIRVCRHRFVKRGENETFKYYLNGLNAGSVVLKAGNVDYSLRNISPILDDTTSFMTGTTTGFVKLNDTYGLKAQADSGFTGNLDLRLTSTTGASLTPGWRSIFVSTSIPGVYGTKTASVYIAEDEAPTINGINVTIGTKIIVLNEVNVSIKANASDKGTYNSGIAWCEFNISNTYHNISDCTYSETLAPGNYHYTVRAYDGALTTSDWKNIDFVVPNRPLQDGPFYDPYGGPNKINYPDRKHFYPLNSSDLVNIGVNFNGGSGFTSSSTGCKVTIINKTDTVSVQNINLNATAIPGKAVCNGQINLSKIDPGGNASKVPLDVYHFYVSVNDTSNMPAESDVQSINVCRYKFNNRTGEYECMDQCDIKALSNKAPILILNISNQSWPRGTKLTVIDLDDHFYDPDHDELTYRWEIDTTRINVSVDPLTKFVTFDPDPTFTGVATIIFYASDGISETPSNPVQLEVTYVPLILPTIPAGGGGGGGGAAAKANKTEICKEDWICSTWSVCFPNSQQTRTCRDRNECGTQMDKPETTRSCTYIPTCRDRIKNQGEEGVDCGGPCKPCATCHDGIKNQGEMNIDCGGPCPSCRVHIMEKVMNWHAMLLAMSLALMGLLATLILLTRLLRRKYLRIKAKSLNYYMRLNRMFEKKKEVKKELPIMHWVNVSLDKIEADVMSKENKEVVNEIDKLVRIFFKRVFFIRYAFTDEELIEEIEKHKIAAPIKKATAILFEELAQIKYGGLELNKEEIQTLISQVRVITERVVSEIEKKKKTRISISEKDITKINQTLKGAKKLSLKNLFGKK